MPNGRVLSEIGTRLAALSRERALHPTPLDVRSLLTLVSLFFIALFVLGVVVQLRTWRRLRAVRPWMIVISQGAAFLSMVVFSVLTARPPGAVAWVLLLGLGGAAGLL